MIERGIRTPSQQEQHHDPRPQQIADFLRTTCRDLNLKFSVMTIDSPHKTGPIICLAIKPTANMRIFRTMFEIYPYGWGYGDPHTTRHAASTKRLCHLLKQEIILCTI